MTVSAARPAPSRRLSLVVAASLIVGFLLPIVLALGPAAGGGESRMTGAALLGWGIGWALIALLSTRFTDAAAAMGVRASRHPRRDRGRCSSRSRRGRRRWTMLAWVWPVPVLVLAVWLILRVRRDVPGRSRWLLYPVVGVLALLAVGGAVETVTEATDGSRSAVRR